MVIEITDVNEAPSEPVELLSDFAISGMASVIVPENSMAVAMYESGEAASWKHRQMGPDRDDEDALEISNSGALTFAEAPGLRESRG